MLEFWKSTVLRVNYLNKFLFVSKVPFFRLLWWEPTSFISHQHVLKSRLKKESIILYGIFISLHSNLQIWSSPTVLFLVYSQRVKVVRSWEWRWLYDNHQTSVLLSFCSEVQIFCQRQKQRQGDRCINNINMIRI